MNGFRNDYAHAPQLLDPIFRRLRKAFHMIWSTSKPARDSFSLYIPMGGYVYYSSRVVRTSLPNRNKTSDVWGASILCQRTRDDNENPKDR